MIKQNFIVTDYVKLKIGRSIKVGHSALREAEFDLICVQELDKKLKLKLVCKNLLQICANSSRKMVGGRQN